MGGWVGGGDGVGCRKIFARNWSPDTTVATVLGAIYSLLLDPEPKDPLDSRLAELFLTDRRAYISEVEDHTRRHAAATAYEAAKKAVMGEAGYWRATRETAVGEKSRRSLVCPLTRQLFREPVTTPDGVTYERSAIVSHLAECRALGLPPHDPTLSSLDEGVVHPLTEKDLVADEVVAREAALYAAGVEEVHCLPSHARAIVEFKPHALPALCSCVDAAGASARGGRGSRAGAVGP